MPSQRVRGYRGIAYNPVPNSENRIHGDEVAKQHGFRGGLVPGVVVSAYLLDPALQAFGLDALKGSYAEVTVHNPLYDGGAFEVAIESQSKTSYRAALTDDEGTRCADGSFELREAPELVPLRRNLERVPRAAEREPATRAVLERMQLEGMRGLRARFDAEHEMARYHPKLDAQPAIVHPNPGGYAHFAFLLGVTNWAIARNVKLGPWLHLQTWSHHFKAIPFGSELWMEPKIHALFERKGHEFVDIDVAAFDDKGEAVMDARMRCIYRLRGA
jgi:hypothetical protein